MPAVDDSHWRWVPFHPTHLDRLMFFNAMLDVGNGKISLKGIGLPYSIKAINYGIYLHFLGFQTNSCH